MTRDIDRLASHWLLLAAVSVPLHAWLVRVLLDQPWLWTAIGAVLEASPGWADGLSAIGVGAAAVWIAAPAVVAIAVGLALLDRRPWAVPLAALASIPAALLAPPLGAVTALHTAWVLAHRPTRARFVDEGPTGWRLSGVLSLNAVPVREVDLSVGAGLVGAPLGVGAVSWSGDRTVAVVDAAGQAHVVDPTHPARFQVGAAAVQLAVVPELPVRRLSTAGLPGHLAWLTVVVAATLVVQQGTMAWEIVKCPLFGIDCPAASSSGSTAAFTAEYLSRLLKKDYAGEDEGVMERKLDRPDADRKTEDERHFYLPAGAEGPKTAMGGAAETAPEPVRTPDTDTEPPLPKKKQAAQERATAAEGAVPVPAAEVAGEGVADADRDLPVDGAEEEVPAPAAEEKEGFGLTDWYDAQDKRLDDMEVETMIRVAKFRLRIDPNDASALQVLSYYQYLALDYDAAEATYDKFIALLPDDASGYNNKALIYKRRGQYQKEEALYRVALALEPNDVTALNNLGVNLAHQRRFDEALSVMKALETLDPGDPYADLHRSKIYAEMGKDEEAYRFLEQSLRGMAELDTLHHIEFRQDIRLDPSFAKIRETERFRSILLQFYGKDTPLQP